MLRTIDMIIAVIKKTINEDPYLKIKFNHPSPFRTHTPRRGYNRKYHIDEILPYIIAPLGVYVLKGYEKLINKYLQKLDKLPNNLYDDSL